MAAVNVMHITAEAVEIKSAKGGFEVTSNCDLDHRMKV
jgi:hypothetical protein